MTLILSLDLNILKTYLRTKDEVCRSSQSKVRAGTGHTDTFCSFDLDLDLMILIHKFDLDIMTTYLLPQMKFLWLSKVRQLSTDKHTYHTHSQTQR